MDNQIVLQDAFSFRELAEQCEALSENGPPKKLCEHLTVMAAAVTRHPLQSIQPSPWPSPPILLPPSPSHPSPLAAAITTSERESHYRSHPWWWSSQLETPATCSGCAWLAGYRGWGGGGAVEVWYRGFVWWELHLRCELALPLQSGRWMTNEVCLFHSLSLSPFFVFILPPPPFTLLLSVRVEKEKGSSCGSAWQQHNHISIQLPRLPILPSRQPGMPCTLTHSPASQLERGAKNLWKTQKVFRGLDRCLIWPRDIV